MLTRITFQNQSLNPNVAIVGAFWDVPAAGQGTRERYWFLIRRCSFDWARAFAILWDPTGRDEPVPQEVTEAPALTLDGCGRRIRNHVLRETSEHCPRFRGPDRIRMVADPCRTGPGGGLVFDSDFRGSEISLAGVAQMDVAMTGGTPGSRATELVFTPYNLRLA